MKVISTQQQLPLNPENLQQVKQFYGIYRLTGFVAKLDKQQRPYWIVNICDAVGTLSVYLFNEPENLQHLHHGAFVNVSLQKCYKGKQCYFELTNLTLRSITEVSDTVTLQTLPFLQCPKAETLLKLQKIINNIETNTLRHFILDVLRPYQTCSLFFQVPASLNHHHNYTGGLLDHSIECALIVKSLPNFSILENDIGVVCALLHDIGKIKTLDARMRRKPLGSLVDHSCLTLEICAMALNQLDTVNNEIAEMIRHIWTCASPGSRYGYKAQSAIAHAVQLADRLSAEQAQLSKGKTATITHFKRAV